MITPVLKETTNQMPLRQTSRALCPSFSGVLLSILAFLFCLTQLALAQSVQHSPIDEASNTSPAVAAVGDDPQQAAQANGVISGTVVDQAGALAAGAQVQLARPGQSQSRQVLSGDDGQFSFGNVTPGPFQITVTAPGFDSKTFDGTLTAGQAFIVPQIVLPVAAATTDVRVGVSTEEVAEAEVQEQYKQKVLGFIPNYYATYVDNPAPLPTHLKFQLAWKSVTNPVTFLGVAMLAGIYQAGDQLSGYGQGAAGYGDRVGAAYGDVFIGTFIDSAIFPTLFHQDPRYVYKGTGTKKSRLVYALENAVICRGDNGKRQFNYSAVVGSFVTSGISYTYYPAANRGGGLMAESALIRIAEGSLAGVFQEFVVKKLTPHLQHQAQQP
jgi:Carboxypeptidase regulatory-like domain